MKLLEGKNILITGGSRGIGKSIVEVLFNSGANVGFTFSSSESAANEIAKNLLKKEIGEKQFNKIYNLSTPIAAASIPFWIVAKGPVWLPLFKESEPSTETYQTGPA